MVQQSVRKYGARFSALTLGLLVICVSLMVFDHKRQLDKLRNWGQVGLSLPIKNAASWPSSIKVGIGDFFVNHNELLKTSEAQKKEIVWLKASLANYSILEAENRRLKRLLESTAVNTRPVIIAEVIDSRIDANKHHIEIRKGSDSKAFVGQIVIDENGVVGQITQVYPNTSVISLITDSRQRIPVFVERNRLRMIARGSGYLDTLEMEFVALDADIRIGDRLVTSGLGARYPRGYPIGEVISVEHNPANLFTTVKAKPFAALDKVLEVLLISSETDLSELSYAQ